MKINILYKFRDSAWGGANQFLKALRKYFISQDCYADAPEDADVIIFISYPFNSEWFYQKVWKLKKDKRVIVVNRMNGPISLYREKDKEIDDINFRFNSDVADGTIFQSEWSRWQCSELGMMSSQNETIIGNSPDPTIFYPCEYDKRSTSGEKIRLVASSWSNNLNKGFDVYEFLDNNLDFNRFEMTFIGNSPVNFKNIKHIPPLSPEELASELREHDIFVFASKLETYSNSLAEALHCGLPVIARDNSSQATTVGNGGLFFNDIEDVLMAIDDLARNLKNYRLSIRTTNIQKRGEEYYSFCKKIYGKALSGKFTVKKWSRLDYLALKMAIYRWKIHKNIRTVLRSEALSG